MEKGIAVSVVDGKRYSVWMAAKGKRYSEHVSWVDWVG